MLRTGARRSPLLLLALLIAVVGLAAACGDDDEKTEITIGQVQPETGVLGPLGIPIIEGVKLAVSVINAAGEAAADYRTLVCSAIHQVYGLGDVPGFARTLLRANYLWEGVLAARYKEALTPHFEYTAALLRVAGAIRGGNEEPDYAQLSAAHTALNSADPHYLAVCQVTGRVP